MAGFLEAFNDPSTQGALSLASNLMRASGPSAMPVPFGAALGNAFQGYLANQGELTKQRQAQTLIDLEKQKTALTAAQVNAALHAQAIKDWALGGMVGPMPTFQGAALAGTPGVLAQAPQAVPQGALAAPGVSPQPMPQGAPAPLGGVLGGLPTEIQKAIQFRIAGLPEVGAAIEKQSEPVVGRESGIFRKRADGTLELDPGWVKGEQQRIALQKAEEDKHTIVDVPLPNGQTVKMTRAQQLALVNRSAPSEEEAVSAVKAAAAAGLPGGVTVASGMPGIVTGQTTGAKSAAETSGTKAGGVQAEIDTEAEHALQSKRILNEMRGLAQNFEPSKLSPFKRAVGEWAQAIGLKGFDEQIKAADNMQAMQKLTAALTTQAMKQFTNRGTQMEFNTFLKNNPNAELTPQGFLKVIDFMEKGSDMGLAKQQAFVEWKKTHKLEDAQDFLAEWNKKMNEEMPSTLATPPAGKVRKYNPATGKIE